MPPEQPERQHTCSQRCCTTAPKQHCFEDDVGHPPTGALEPVGKPLGEVLREAGRRALGGGVPGAAAMGLQVGLLMWLRTTINYQLANGGGTFSTIRHLYREGGVGRFYKGVGPALLQGPLSRFGDTAANTGILALLDANESTRTLPSPVKTAAASLTAASWRICIMPIDVFKTSMQVRGKSGVATVLSKVKVSGPRVLWHGSLAAAGATAAGHFPWFATFNFLNEKLPEAPSKGWNRLRNAFLGLCSSAVSDTVSNSIRVVKVSRQVSAEPLTYAQAAKNVIAKDGVRGLFGRGLATKLASNGVSAMLFTVIWRELIDRMGDTPKK